MEQQDKKTTTKRGTPHAKTWTPDWIDRVEDVEAGLDHRICGAQTPAGCPCTLQSDHPTGRCRFHGGTDLIGAPDGNQNARIHGLYSRRLQTCGPHCPLWESCAFANDDVLAMDPKQRPKCAYEQQEYDAVIESMLPEKAPETPFITEYREKYFPDHKSHGPDIHFAHTIALLQVMMSRAAAALSHGQFTDTVTSKSNRYQMQTTKVHAALQAFLRITREYRTMRTAYHRQQPPLGKNRSLDLARVLQPYIEDHGGIFEQSFFQNPEDISAAPGDAQSNSEQQDRELMAQCNDPITPIPPDSRDP